MPLGLTSNLQEMWRIEEEVNTSTKKQLDNPEWGTFRKANGLDSSKCQCCEKKKSAEERMWESVYIKRDHKDITKYNAWIAMGSWP